jgi:hypothetical protein
MVSQLFGGGGEPAIGTIKRPSVVHASDESNPFTGGMCIARSWSRASDPTHRIAFPLLFSRNPSESSADGVLSLPGDWCDARRLGTRRSGGLKQLPDGRDHLAGRAVVMARRTRKCRGGDGGRDRR